jgi:sugar phosphate isomerase/epimerase
LYLAALARAAAELGGDILVLGSPLQRNIPAGSTREQATDFALETLTECLPELERSAVYLCLEPLGHAETNFLNTAAEGASLIHRLAHPFVKLHLDVKAMSDEAQPIPELIHTNRHLLKHFHANDPNRRGPGFGATDFKPILQALQATDYPGWVSVEVFDYTPDPDTIARASIHYLQECEATLAKR